MIEDEENKNTPLCQQVETLKKQVAELQEIVHILVDTDDVHNTTPANIDSALSYIIKSIQGLQIEKGLKIINEYPNQN